MTDTIQLLDPNEPNEGLRQMYRQLWSDPRNVTFRNKLRADTVNYRWITLDGTDPLPNVSTPKTKRWQCSGSGPAYTVECDFETNSGRAATRHFEKTGHAVDEQDRHA